MSIGFLDLRAAYLELQAEIDQAVARALASGWYVGGPELERFESEFAAFCGAQHCVGVANGLDALHLALRAMNVGPGDEVIVASNSYIATVLAVSMVGATPVMVEPDPTTFNLDPARVASAISARTKVILPTHLYGQPADLDALSEIAKEHGLTILEDAAQAHGARYKNAPIGGHSTAVAWSFYPSKNLGAFGDAGAVTTNDPDIAASIRELGNYGSATRYVNRVRGVNSRLDPVQAAVLSVKLKYLSEWNQRRSAIARQYRSALASSFLELPVVPAWASPAWHLYVVQSDNRDRLSADLAEAGVQTLIHYPIPPHRQKAYAELELPAGSLPIAERLAERVLSLPIGPHLAQDGVEQIITTILGAR